MSLKNISIVLPRRCLNFIQTMRFELIRGLRLSRQCLGVFKLTKNSLQLITAVCDKSETRYATVMIWVNGLGNSHEFVEVIEETVVENAIPCYSTR